jgi:glutamate-1-semialdehyde aminotransferase
MLEAGVYLPPSPFESALTSTQHGETELQLLEASLHRAWPQ